MNTNRAFLLASLVLSTALRAAAEPNAHYEDLPSVEALLRQARGAARAMPASPRATALQAPAAAVSSKARLDAGALLAHLHTLSSDAMAGRRAGSKGNALARQHIVAELARLGVKPAGNSLEHPFGIKGLIPNFPDFVQSATNVVGVVRGRSLPDRYLLISAHYDHIGQGQEEPGQDSIFNGADDDGSGTATLLALAAYLSAQPLERSVVFFFSDAEELGLYGAKQFVSQPPVPLAAIDLQLNLDMMGRDDNGGLYAVGRSIQPLLDPWVGQLAPRARVVIHPGDAAMDKAMLPRCDSAPFHASGVPTLTISSLLHADYHKVTDEYSRIDHAFFVQAAETVLEFVLEADRNPPTARAVAATP